MPLIDSDSITFLDFQSFKLGNRPNEFYVCPPIWSHSHAHGVSPTFECGLVDLKKAWQATIFEQARTRLLLKSHDDLHYELEQRSKIFGFPDRISAALLPVSDLQSTLALYSRSIYGYSDLGVNKSRIASWIDQIADKLDPT